MNVGRARLEFAAEAFLERLSIAQMKAQSDGQFGRRTLNDLSDTTRSALLSALQAAITAVTPAADDRYANWIANRNISNV